MTGSAFGRRFHPPDIVVPVMADSSTTHPTTHVRKETVPRERKGKRARERKAHRKVPATPSATPTPKLE